MEVGEKYLPVGTICLLKDGTKKVMVTGFCIKSPEIQDKVFDYIGCLYPEGVISSDQNLLFDHSQIVQIFHKGYITPEETEFKNKLKQLTVSNESENIIENDLEVLQTNPEEVLDNLI